MEFVRLVSNDDIVFKVHVDIAKQAGILKVLIEESGFTDCDDDFIPLPNINAKTLSKLIEWANRNKHDKSSLSKSELEELKAWRTTFLSVDHPLLLDIIMSANYLDMAELREAACRHVADMMKNKFPDELRKTFNIVNDFTPEEEEEVRRSNDWALLDSNESGEPCRTNPADG